MQLLTHETERLIVFHEGSTRRDYLTAEDLQALVSELGSWLRFFTMLRQGGVANMTAYCGRRPDRMKVCRMGSVPDEATYATV